MFNLKTNWVKGGLRSRRNLSIERNMKPGRTEEQISLWVFFAGSSPTPEILSMASEHVKTLG
jgi:hypothetical protein